MGPPLEWVAAAYAGKPQITMPYGLGDTTDLTDALAVLKLAGLPAVIESRDTIRLAGGRRVRLPTCRFRAKMAKSAARWQQLGNFAKSRGRLSAERGRLRSSHTEPVPITDRYSPVGTSPLGCVSGPEELRLNSGPRRSW